MEKYLRENAAKSEYLSATRVLFGWFKKYSEWTFSLFIYKRYMVQNHEPNNSREQNERERAKYGDK